MAAAKDCHALTSYYVKKYIERFGRDPEVNRFSARWGFDSILMGMNSKEIHKLIDYYFTTPSERAYSLDWFFYNYDKLRRAMNEAERDAEHRRKLMEESKARAEAWRQSGKRGIASIERSSKE